MFKFIDCSVYLIGSKITSMIQMISFSKNRQKRVHKRAPKSQMAPKSPQMKMKKIRRKNPKRQKSPQKLLKKQKRQKKTKRPKKIKRQLGSFIRTNVGRRRQN